MALGDAIRKRNAGGDATDARCQAYVAREHLDVADAVSCSMHRVGLVLVALALALTSGCGRLGFAPTEGDGGATDDGADGDAVVDAAGPASRPRSLSASYYATCAVLADGTLWCWGDNAQLALGLGATTGVVMPTQVGTDTDWAEVAIDLEHGCARKTVGTLWCWGKSLVGDGTTTPRPSPVQIGGASDWTAITVAGTSCGLRGAGALWCWGSYPGDGTISPAPAPIAVAAGELFRTVATETGQSTCAIHVDGTRWCWGDNTYGTIGDGTLANRVTPAPIGTQTWLAYAHGTYASCAIATDTSLWCSSTVLFATSTLIPLTPDLGWTDVDVGERSVCALRGTGQLWCWGENAQGQFGTGDDAPLATLTLVDGTGRWTALDSGPSHRCGVRDDRLVCAGVGTRGELGDLAARFDARPSAVLGGPWSTFALGGLHGCALAGGAMSCWGNADAGQTSRAFRLGTSVPTQVGALTDWTAVAATGQSTRAIRAGELRQWGSYKTGNSSGGNTPMPTLVDGGPTWTLVAAGESHDCALQASGALWCWGRNSTGELGDGTATASTTPVQVGVATYTHVDVGEAYSCAIRTDASLWCWGRNSSGQLGDGSTTNRSAPVEVAPGTTWRVITAGYSHACAIRPTGSLWCWGANGTGQVGDGTTTQRTTPVQVGTATDWREVHAGTLFTCGARADSSVWCWGIDDRGQLGDGGGPAQLAPVQVGTGTTWVELRAGGQFACARDAAGALTCWGAPDDGALGNGRSSSMVPVRPAVPTI